MILPEQPYQQISRKTMDVGTTTEDAMCDYYVALVGWSERREKIIMQAHAFADDYSKLRESYSRMMQRSSMTDAERGALEGKIADAEILGRAQEDIRDGIRKQRIIINGFNDSVSLYDIKEHFKDLLVTRRRTLPLLNQYFCDDHERKNGNGVGHT